MKTEIKLGQSVTFDEVLIRKSKWDQEKYARKKEWVSMKKVTHTGIVIGKRTLSNGFSHYDPDCGNIFDPKEFITAYIVVFNMKNKPVLVLPEKLIIES